MINDTHHHYPEAGIIDDCSDSERFSLPDLDLSNLRASHKPDGKVRGKSPNLGRHKKHSENFSSELGNFREGNSKIFRKKSTDRERSHQETEERQFRSKQKSPSRGKTHLRAGQSQEQAYPEFGTEHKRRSPRRGPSLIDRRMEFLFSEREQQEAKGSTSGNQTSARTDFPFRPTPSGHFKILPDQVVFSSKKVSVLVADPTRTKVNIQKELEKTKLKSAMPPIPSKLFQQPHNVRMELPETPRMRSTEMNSDGEEMNGDGPESLKPEMKLERLGYSNFGPIDYSKLTLPTKTNLYHELYRRISNYINTDVQVVIGQEEFSCHSMVLQTYSEFFEKQVGMRRIELPSNEVSVNAFVVIYDWMITGKDCVTLLRRDNILEIFVASRYLIIKELEEQCWAFIDSEDVFSEDTAFMLYIEAKKLNIPPVKELMIPRIRQFFLMLVSSQDFVELEIDEIVVILNSNYIAVNCEMEVLMSAVRWLKADWDHRIQYLVRIIACIRFGLIAPWQLVDIKRNPENPELLEIMSVPEITKMVDDGLSEYIEKAMNVYNAVRMLTKRERFHLAGMYFVRNMWAKLCLIKFVIIKYWYGHQSEDYAHWIELLGLTEPQERNWAGSEKNYVTYRQFLAFLDTYRRDNLLEKNKIRSKKVPDVPSVQACYPPADLISPSGSMDKELGLHTFKSPRSPRTVTTDGSPSPSTVSQTLTEEEAATTIQSAYRVYKHKKHSHRQHAGEHNPPKVLKTILKSPREKSPHKVLSQNVKVLAMFATQHNAQESKSQKKIDGSPIHPGKQKFLVKGSLFSNDRESVLVFGGLDPHTSYGVNRNTGKDIYRYLPETNCWDYVGELPEPRQHHSTAFFRGRVYLVGGANPIPEDGKDKGVVVNTVWSFEPVSRTWYRESSMITPRKNFGLVVSHMKLYAIGGQDKHSKMLTSVERFEPGGKWEEVAPLKNARMGMACAKYRDCIWVAGGMCGSRRNPLTNVVECYDTRKNEWTRIENLRFPRCFSTLFTMNDRLYLIGGAGRMSEKDKNTSSVSAIDIWDPRDREWKLKTELAIPRHGHCVAYLGTQILVIGGVTTVYMRALSNTECYCCERFTWVRGISPLPTTLSGHSAVTLPPASLM